MNEERALLATIDTHLEDDRVTVTVTLGYGNEVYAGVAEGEAEPALRARLVGEATLRAIELLPGFELELDLSAVGTSELGPARIALAQIRDPHWSDYLVGSALVREGDAATATARAVLDAMNRRLVSAAS